MKKVSLKLAGSLSLLGVIGAVAATPAFATLTAHFVADKQPAATNLPQV
jgi:hypothetical protein